MSFCLGTSRVTSAAKQMELPGSCAAYTPESNRSTSFMAADGRGHNHTIDTDESRTLAIDGERLGGRNRYTLGGDPLEIPVRSVGYKARTQGTGIRSLHGNGNCKRCSQQECARPHLLSSVLRGWQAS